MIEIIVSISIFTVVMVITMGALLTLNDASRKAQAIRTVIDNLNFTLEDMNRKIRTGDSYYCYETPMLNSTHPLEANVWTHDCPTAGGPTLVVRPQAGSLNAGTRTWLAYSFEKNPVTGRGGIFVRTGEAIGQRIQFFQTRMSITSPEVDIKKMDYRVVGAEVKLGTPKRQPMVIINISGTVDLSKEKLRTDFSLQTAISQRNFDK